MSENKGNIIQLSWSVLQKSKEAISDFVGFKQKNGFMKIVKPEDEHKALENYNSFHVVDTRLLKNQPIKENEIQEHPTLTDKVQEKIIELQNIFLPNKKQDNKEDNLEQKNKEQKNNYDDWQPM